MLGEIHRSYEFGSFQLDPERHSLLRNGQTVSLRPKVFDTLVVLVENRGAVLSKDYLLKALWPETFVEENNLYRSISSLRKALGESPNEHGYIETFPKIGFRFVADVKESTDGSIHDEKGGLEAGDAAPVRGQNAAISPRAGSAGPILLAIPEKCVRALRSRRTRALLLLAAPALLLASLSFYFRHSRNAGAAINSVAVLPFVNMGGDPATEYLADGVTDTLILKLSRLADLKVVSRASTFRYRGKNVDPYKTGRELNVSSVLTGTIVPQGKDVFISIELADMRDGRRLWGERYKRKLEDILAVQDEISEIATQKLQLKLSGEDKRLLRKRYTGNPGAYHLYLKGLYLWNKKTQKAVTQAISYFEDAIKNDPSYALAYAQASQCYSWLSLSSVFPSDKWRPTALKLADRAVALDEELGEGHAALAYAKFANWEWSNIEEEFERSLQLSPNSSDVHERYSVYLGTIGEYDRALNEIRRAEELDPVSMNLGVIGARHLYMQGSFDTAIQQLRDILAIDGDFSLVHRYLADAYVQKGMYPEAIQEYETTSRIESALNQISEGDRNSGTSSAAINAKIAYVWARAGRQQDARKSLPVFEQLFARSLVSPLANAQIYIALGDNDSAFQWLEKAFAGHVSRLLWLGVDPIYAPLRKDPRFLPLIRRIGLAQAHVESGWSSADPIQMRLPKKVSR